MCSVSSRAIPLCKKTIVSHTLTKKSIECSFFFTGKWLWRNTVCVVARWPIQPMCKTHALYLQACLHLIPCMNQLVSSRPICVALKCCSTYAHVQAFLPRSSVPFAQPLTSWTRWGASKPTYKNLHLLALQFFYHQDVCWLAADKVGSFRL